MKPRVYVTVVVECEREVLELLGEEGVARTIRSVLTMPNLALAGELHVVRCETSQLPT